MNALPRFTVPALVLRPLQILLGLIFFTTSLGKLLDNRGFAAVLGTYRLFPQAILLPLALSISLFELFLSYRLFQKDCGRFAASSVLAINTGYLVLALVTILRGISLTNCGCFGVFLARPLGWNTVVEDGVLLAITIFFYLTRIRTDSP